MKKYKFDECVKMLLYEIKLEEKMWKRLYSSNYITDIPIIDKLFILLNNNGHRLRRKIASMALSACTKRQVIGEALKMYNTHKIMEG